MEKLEKDEIYNGKLLYFEFHPKNVNSKNYFSCFKSVNLNDNSIKEFKLQKEFALAITNNNELIQWQKGKDTNSSKENNFLAETPSYIFNKIKFKSISINSTICLALDSQSKVMTWGHNSNGLLGLGYDITSVESPVYIEELKEEIISQISLSENHAVALSHSGIAYSWGLGKYGELGQVRTIFSPLPLQINSERTYLKVFCNNFVTCFLDLEGHFSYFGVIIRNLEIHNLNLTIKNLLEDESMNDGKTLVQEIVIEEIENEKVLNVVIGNGFVGLLCDNGDLYVLEYKDKLTKLYTKYFCYDIVRYNNKIFGFAKNENSYYLCQWGVNYNKEKFLSGDTWNSTFWEIKGNIQIISCFKFIDIGIIKDDINKVFILENNNARENINSSYDNKISFEFDSNYDDSFNLRFKRAKQKNNTFVCYTSLYTNKSKLPSYKNSDRTYYNNSLRLNYNYSLNKPITNIGWNKFKNQKYANNNNNIINENDINEDKNNTKIDKENIDMNMNENLLEYRQNELNDYRKEIDNVINNFKKRKKNKNTILLEDGKTNDKFNFINDETIPFIQNKKLISKSVLSNSALNSKYNKYNLKQKITNNKDYPSNNNFNNNKKNTTNNNNSNPNQSQKEICSNIDEFFGKESSNIIKNDDIFSDLNEFSNTNFNYLCNNIDASNKIYNGNNSNNLLINSDRTLNFSGNNYFNKNNKRNISPRFVNDNDSINLNSIISKSNDFFSEYGKRQSRNNFIENIFVKKELNKNSKGSKIYKTKYLNIDILESNIESNKSSENYYSENNQIKEKKTKDEFNIKKLIDNFNEDNKEKNNLPKLTLITDGLEIDIENETFTNNDETNLNIIHSSPNLIIIKNKNIERKEFKRKKFNKYKRKFKLGKGKNSKIFGDNNKNILSSQDNEYILNQGRKTGNFYFSNEEEEKKNSSLQAKNNHEHKIIKKGYLSYFCFLVNIYMRKKLFKICINKINDYKNKLARKYATKMIYNIMKRRIIFFEIKFFRRLKKIMKFYIKYEMRLNIINKRKTK